MDIGSILPRRFTGTGRLRFTPKAAKEETDGFWNELAEVRSQLETVENQFDMATDSTAIEVCCYQLKAVSARYGQLLQEARRRGLKREPFAE